MIWAADALAGRRVLVTGGSRGIGAACCRLFARCGATVAVHYRRAEKEARELRDALAGAGDRAHLVVAADLAAPEGSGRIVAAIEREWAALDVLVNNAGVWVENRLAALDEERLRETLELNLVAPITCAAGALALLRRSPSASIVNISSTAGQRGEASYGPYAASKGALIALTKSWAAELAPVIRVNAVAPGWVDTDMAAGSYEGGGRTEIEATIPLGRVATAEDVAGPVVFLATEAARHVTGEILNVNGGSVLCG